MHSDREITIGDSMNTDLHHNICKFSQNCRYRPQAIAILKKCSNITSRGIPNWLSFHFCAIIHCMTEKLTNARALTCVNKMLHDLTKTRLLQLPPVLSSFVNGNARSDNIKWHTINQIPRPRRRFVNYRTLMWRNIRQIKILWYIKTAIAYWPVPKSLDFASLVYWRQFWVVVDGVHLQRSKMMMIIIKII